MWIFVRAYDAQATLPLYYTRVITTHDSSLSNRTRPCHPHRGFRFQDIPLYNASVITAPASANLTSPGERFWCRETTEIGPSGMNSGPSTPLFESLWVCERGV